jgi:hypothetical protein
LNDDSAKKRTIGSDLVLATFGGVLGEQGRGYYVALELFAIVGGTVAAGRTPLPPPDERLAFIRNTHDFARRLLAEPNKLSEEEREGIGGPTTERALRSLLGGLTVRSKGRQGNPNWRTAHFLPYVGDLIHYEAVLRGESTNPAIWRNNPERKPSIERNRYRGAGGLAHRILRSDEDSDRLAQTRASFAELVRPSESSLGQVAAALAAKDRAKEDEPPDAPDSNERDALCLESAWLENLRAGVHRILTSNEISRARRVDAMLHWVPFCIAMHQLERAHTVLGHEGRPRLTVACGNSTPRVRKLATEELSAAVNKVYNALTHKATEGGRSELLESYKWRSSPKTFFTTTLATIGLLNAMTGRRHFKLGTELLEAIVIATVDEEMEFGRFCQEVMYERLGLVVDEDSASLQGLLLAANRADFELNREGLLDMSRELGMMREYSDATRMIRVRL